jgi:hypothetical protein
MIEARNKLLQQIKNLREALDLLEASILAGGSKYTPDSEEENRAKPRC